MSDANGYRLALALGVCLGAAGTALAKWAGLPLICELPWWGCVALPVAFLALEHAPGLLARLIPDDKEGEPK